MAITAGQAYAPGSAAAAMMGSSSIALPAMTGMPSIPSLTSSSSADGKVTAGFDNSGFVVNIGSGSAGSGLPAWALPLAAVAGLVLLARRWGHA